MRTPTGKTITILEACALLSISRTTLWRLVKLYEATKGKRGLGPLNRYGKTRRAFPPDVIHLAIKHGIDGGEE